MYIRVSLQGKLGTTEVWSCSLNWGIFGVIGSGPNQDLVDAIRDKLVAWLINANVPTTVSGLIASNGDLSSVRVELRNEDESTASVSLGQLATPIVGANGPSKSPQDSIVLSMRTHTPGPSGRGRIYWPAIGATLDSAFKLSAPTPASLVSAFRTFLNGIGTQINAGFGQVSIAATVVLSVRSIKNHVCRDVTTIQIGDRLDTQRRRRDALPETYSSSVYP